MKQAVHSSAEALREKIIQAVHLHKTSWIQLGQYLFSVHHDKCYKEWGFLTFDAYCLKEIGLKPATAMKMLKSYCFLEKEEPAYVASAQEEPEGAVAVPHYESVNLLRLARENTKFDEEDFASLRQSVLKSAKEPKEVRAEVKQILLTKEEDQPEEAKKTKRASRVQRLVSSLKSARKDLGQERDLPPYLLKQLDDLIEKLEDQVESLRIES